MQILVFGVIAIFFISTSGLTVYRHLCAHNNSLTIALSETNDCPPDNNATEIVSHACCNTNPNQPIQISDNCCQNSVDILNIDTDVINFNPEANLISHFVALSFPTIPTIYQNPEVNKVLTENRPPSIPSTTQRLSSLQLYLI